MSIKDVFKKQTPPGPEVVEIKKEKTKKEKPVVNEIVDFSFNEYRFGHNIKTGKYFKIYPVPAGLFGFWNYETEEISFEEYSLWEDAMKNPGLYIVTAEPIGRGFKKYSIIKR